MIADLKKFDYRILNAASDNHINAILISDFINAVINDAKKINYQPNTIITKKDKEHIFNIIAQLYYLDIPYTQYLDLEEKYRATDFFNTINYIQECQCFSRRSHPFRKEVEKRILKHLKDSNFDKKNKLIVTEFASGNLFEIFMIANLLIEHGYKNLQLNCIDLEYSPILSQYQLYLPNNEISKNNGITTFHLLPEYPWKKMPIFFLKGDKIMLDLQKIKTLLHQLSNASEKDIKLIKTELTILNKRLQTSDIIMNISDNIQTIKKDLTILVKNNLTEKNLQDHLQVIKNEISRTIEKLQETSRFNSGELATNYQLLTKILKMHIITKNNVRKDIIDETSIQDEINNLKAQRNDELSYLLTTLSNFDYHKKIIQFLRWFSDDKDNNVTVVFYDDVKKYLDDCSKNEKLKSDIVVAIDYYPWDTFQLWDNLRKNALKNDGAAYTVTNFSKSGDHLKDEQYYLSIGTSKTLHHYEWILQDKNKINWKNETRLIPTWDKNNKIIEKKETFKVPNYAHYALKQIKEIPESKFEDEYFDDVDQKWIDEIKIVPAIPEILPGDGSNNDKNSIEIFRKALMNIV